MRLKINDGYTLSATVPEKQPEGGPEVPVVNLEYRPAMPEALYNWKYDSRNATSGTGLLEIDAAFVVAHLVSWDVVVPGDAPSTTKPAAVNVENVRNLPQPYLDGIIAKIATWAARQPSKNGKPEPSKLETAEKNSAAG